MNKILVTILLLSAGPAFASVNLQRARAKCKTASVSDGVLTCTSPNIRGDLILRSRVYGNQTYAQASDPQNNGVCKFIGATEGISVKYFEGYNSGYELDENGEVACFVDNEGDSSLAVISEITCK